MNKKDFNERRAHLIKRYYTAMKLHCWRTAAARIRELAEIDSDNVYVEFKYNEFCSNHSLKYELK